MPRAQPLASEIAERYLVSPTCFFAFEFNLSLSLDQMRKFSGGALAFIPSLLCASFVLTGCILLLGARNSGRVRSRRVKRGGGETKGARAQF